MRPIVWARMDKMRPVLVLTRSVAIPRLSQVTVAPISSKVHGIGSEVRVGRRNGLEVEGAVKCDQMVSVEPRLLFEHCGYLLGEQEHELHQALQFAFDLI